VREAYAGFDHSTGGNRSQRADPGYGTTRAGDRDARLVDMALYSADDFWLEQVACVGLDSGGLLGLALHPCDKCAAGYGHTTQCSNYAIVTLQPEPTAKQKSKSAISVQKVLALLLQASRTRKPCSSSCATARFFQRRRGPPYLRSSCGLVRRLWSCDLLRKWRYHDTSWHALNERNNQDCA
jgi:hypothetical protein